MLKQFFNKVKEQKIDKKKEEEEKKKQEEMKN